MGFLNIALHCLVGVIFSEFKAVYQNKSVVTFECPEEQMFLVVFENIRSGIYGYLPEYSGIAFLFTTYPQAPHPERKGTVWMGFCFFVIKKVNNPDYSSGRQK